MKMKKYCQITVLGVVAFATVPMENARAETLYFGIVPQQAATRLANMWLPFMQELSAQTGLDIRFATMKDIPTFEQCLAQGAYDIAYMNPYHYTVFSKKSGYRAFAHQSEKKLKGLIVVKKGSEVTSLAGLDKKKVAFPSPAAFGASVLPRTEMKAEGLKIEPVYVKSHDSVYKSVIAGYFVAGGGVLRTFNSIPQGMRDQLQVIYRTGAYTPHAFAVNGAMPEEHLATIQNAMLDIARHKPGLMKSIGMTGLVTAQDSDWNDVRKLDLSQYETKIVQLGTVKCRFD
ncbi:phosphate ABC transporter substrate-binding protein [Terasakiella brassicae]|uniref:Phosphate ABC transporter substrate-binding protein n=1 Tax=Terasakiella brassicae TaxID=1634917 RepID=A0A917BTI2_9PROT|nr:phosphate/phosphite/phosphonate ABC transporter substrate-binding protein [Terasakiella brassicae]GGF55355.1 phosphate ABC transporter substrate-binding protein [Terasakiella brassicae]